jgi:predicted DNA-binding transcriptional regulator AlpA
MSNIETLTVSDSPENSVDEKDKLPEPGYMDTPAAAHHLGLSSSKMNKLRMTKDGPPFIKIGHRSVRYRREDLDRWMADQLVTQDSPEAA